MYRHAQLAGRRGKLATEVDIALAGDAGESRANPDPRSGSQAAGAGEGELEQRRFTGQRLRCRRGDVDGRRVRRERRLTEVTGRSGHIRQLRRIPARVHVIGGYSGGGAAGVDAQRHGDLTAPQRVYLSRRPGDEDGSARAGPDLEAHRHSERAVQGAGSRQRDGLGVDPGG